MTPEQEKRVEEIGEAIQRIDFLPGDMFKDIRFLLSLIKRLDRDKEEIISHDCLDVTMLGGHKPGTDINVPAMNDRINRALDRLKQARTRDGGMFVVNGATIESVIAILEPVQVPSQGAAPNELLIECQIKDIPKRKPNIVIEHVDAPEPLDTGEYRADFRTKEEAERGAYQEKPYPPPIDTGLTDERRRQIQEEVRATKGDVEAKAQRLYEAFAPESTPAPEPVNPDKYYCPLCEKDVLVWLGCVHTPRPRPTQEVAPAPQTVDEVKKRLEEMGYEYDDGEGMTKQGLCFAFAEYKKHTPFVGGTKITHEYYGSTKEEAALNLWNAVTERMK